MDSQLDISSVLQDLDACLRNIKTNLAWLELKESEWRPGDPPTWVMETGLIHGIRNGASRFVSLATTAHDWLNKGTNEKDKKETAITLRGRLIDMERDFQNLRISKSF